MNARLGTIRQSETRRGHGVWRRAFTLVEILVVISIIGLLMTMLGAVMSNSSRKAREAATTALLQKIEGLLDERRQGFERAVKSNDFKRIVQQRKQTLDSQGIFGVREAVIAAIARKDFFRQLFPQRFEDLADLNTNNIPDAFENDPVLKPEDANGDGLLQGPEDTNGNGKLDGFIRFNHLNSPANPQSGNRVTESSELLYYMLTKMETFGIPPVGESEFSTGEKRDTDGDGLMEFVDGWGQPLRFYRWPTRLLKPSGLFGLDGQPGVAGTDDAPTNGLTDDADEIGMLGSDDYRALNPMNAGRVPRRDLAGLLMDGLPPAPATYVSGGNTYRLQYDSLDEDPDDPYGLIVLEMRRLARPAYAGIPAINVLAAGGYPEGTFPTLDTFHTPLVVSIGADGALGLFEPFVFSDVNGDGRVDYGVLAQPLYDPTVTTPDADPRNNIPSSTFNALTDNLTNRNRRAGKGK